MLPREVMGLVDTDKYLAQQGHNERIRLFKSKLYGVMDSTGSNVRRLIQINTSTGAGTVIGSAGFSSMQALAATPDYVSSVSQSRAGSYP
jgi:hypothetical protein